MPYLIAYIVGALLFAAALLAVGILAVMFAALAGEDVRMTWLGVAVAVLSVILWPVTLSAAAVMLVIGVFAPRRFPRGI